MAGNTIRNRCIQSSHLRIFAVNKLLSLLGVEMFHKKQLGIAVAVSAILFGGQAQAETREVSALRGADFQLEEVLV
ncbi:MAG: hypothetical protein OEV47_13750, partial [Gammaproteobacteria bacterium]|nr:hypothetical protein [Gammaproteobacteria bacterium]